MAESILSLISTEGVVPLFKYWIDEYLHGIWKNSNLNDWNTLHIREEYVRWRLGATNFPRKTFNMTKSGWLVHKKLYDFLSGLDGCHIITIMRAASPSYTFVCDFRSPTRVVMLLLSTFNCLEFNRDTWMTNFLSGVVDDQRESLNMISIQDNLEDYVSEIWIN